ncbi:MAG: ABC transporter permease subunit [Hyphomonadaceae bacterium]|nr:ABC transporter permease subunit [Hyphomonadaceae bacterium]
MLNRILARIPAAYVLRRLLIAIPTMLAIITVAFFMMRAAPGGPFSSDRKLPVETERAIAAKYGLDDPLHIQYLKYLGDVVQGDFGPSFKFKDKDVSEIIADGLPISLTIGGCSMLLAIIVGGGLGILAGLRQNTAADYSVMGISMAGISIPTFVTGPLLLLVFALGFGFFSAGGLTPPLRLSPHNLTLPVITLALPQIAIISRLMRASMIETMRMPHIRTARSKGLGELKVIISHAMPSAVLPLVSYVGPATARVLTGSVVVEMVFGLPGMGKYFVEGAINRDYTLVMGAIIIYAGLIIVLNLIADVLYALLDPKVKYD